MGPTGAKRVRFSPGKARGRGCPRRSGPGSAPELRAGPAAPPRPAPTERRNAASSARPLRALRRQAGPDPASARQPILAPRLGRGFD